jgi:hypothetical protein
MTWNMPSNIRIEHGKHRRNVSLCKVFVSFPNNHRVAVAHRVVPSSIRTPHTIIYRNSHKLPPGLQYIYALACAEFWW